MGIYTGFKSAHGVDTESCKRSSAPRGGVGGSKSAVDSCRLVAPSGGEDCCAMQKKQKQELIIQTPDCFHRVQCHTSKEYYYTPEPLHEQTDMNVVTL